MHHTGRVELGSVIHIYPKDPAKTEALKTKRRLSKRDAMRVWSRSVSGRVFLRTWQFGMPRADSSVKCTRTDQDEAVSRLKRLLVDNANIADVYAVHGSVEVVESPSGTGLCIGTSEGKRK